MANVLPRFNEHVTANVSHKYQIEMPLPAVAMQGAVYKAMDEGRGLDDSVDDRMKKKKKEEKRT